jgi:hypothetical protein
MTPRRIARIALLLSVAILMYAFIATSGTRHTVAAQPRSESADDRCIQVGGMLMTNFGAVDQNTTLGTATGDLRGAVTGTLLGTPQPGDNNTVIFHVQHHWVTESGDTLFFDPAAATTLPLSQFVFAIITYPVHLKGGTGRFAGATGDLNAIGEIDLNSGTVFRYSGHVCFASAEED